MGMNKDDYKDMQMDTFRKMVTKQDERAKSRIKDTNFGFSTTWEKQSVRQWQTRPEKDIKKEAEKQMQEIAKAGKLDTESHMQDVSSMMKKKEVSSALTQAENSVRTTVSGRNISGMYAGQRSEIKMTPEHEMMLQEIKVKNDINKQRKEVKNNEVNEFLQVDDWYFFDKFIIIKSYDDYLNNVRRKINVSEITGVYIIANITKKKIYVGYGLKAVEKCGQHFRRRIGSTDSVPEIREDMLFDDVMGVNFVKLKDTDFDTIEELAKHYINKYNCRAPRGYNKAIVKF